MHTLASRRAFGQVAARGLVTISMPSLRKGPITRPGGDLREMELPAERSPSPFQAPKAPTRGVFMSRWPFV